MQLVDQSEGSTFTTRELARLEAYRAAVAAGFFTDQDGSDVGNDTEMLAALAQDRAEEAQAGYPFTVEERARLEQLKQAVADGERYADDRPPAPPKAAEKPTLAADEPER